MAAKKKKKASRPKAGAKKKGRKPAKRNTAKRKAAPKRKTAPKKKAAPKKKPSARKRIVAKLAPTVERMKMGASEVGQGAHAARDDRDSEADGLAARARLGRLGVGEHGHRDRGEEGLDLGKLYDYDIILLDLKLPDMSGFEVLRSLRVSKVKTPILILSGLAGI